MGISIAKIRRLNCVRLVSKIDDAVDHEASDWDLYSKDPVMNESALKFLSDKKPTVFVCNFELSAKDNSKIQDSMLSGLDDDKQPKISVGAWSLAVARYTLKGIENPQGTVAPIDFKVDSRGYASDETLNILQKAGIISEIFNAYLTLTQSGVEQNAKK